MLLSLLAFWSLVFVGVPWCLGVNGPKFGPKFSWIFSRLRKHGWPGIALAET